MRGPQRSSQIKKINLSATFTLVEIAFNKTDAQNYAVEFNRGAQVYKRLAEIAWVHSQEKKYRYLTGKSITVKLQPAVPLDYEWTVYKITDNQLKDFVASLPADITEAHNSLYDSIKKEGKQFNALLMSSVQGTNIQQQWKNMRNKLPFEHKGLKAINLKKGITATYDLIFNCQLDNAIVEQHKLQMLRKMSKSTNNKIANENHRSLIDEEPNGRSSGILKPSIQMKINTNQNQRRKNETLSDIIESSNQCSSRTNFQDRNHKAAFMMNEIPEEYESSHSIVATKTHDFDRNKDKLQTIDQIQRKRSNSLRQSNDDPHQQGSFNGFDDNFQEGKAGSTFIETPIPSINSKIYPRQQEKVEQKPKGNLKSFLVLIFVVVFSIFALSTQSLHLSQVFKFFKNIKKKGRLKDKIKRSAGNLPKKGKLGAKDLPAWSWSWNSAGEDNNEEDLQVSTRKQRKIFKKK